MQKLAEIRKMVPAVQKSKKGFGYTYVPLEELQAKVTAAMNKFNVNLYPSVVPGSAKITPYEYIKKKATKDGQMLEETVHEFLYTADTLWRWVNNDNPVEFVEVPWFASANMSDASQTVNSANTYQARGFISSFLQLAMTETDPEDYRSKQKATEEAEDKLIAAQIVETIHQYVVAYIAIHPEDSERVSGIVKKHNKVKGKGNENYFNITNSSVATNLLTELRSSCLLNTEPAEIAKNRNEVV